MSNGKTGAGEVTVSALDDRELFRLYLLNLGRTFIAFLFFFKYPLFFSDMGLDGEQQGLVFSMVSLFSIVSTFWIGVVADRVDARYISALGLVLIASFLAGLSAVSSFYAFLLLFAMNGVANQCFTIGSNAYFFKNVGREADKNVPIARFSASSSFGIALAFLAGPVLVSWLGFRTALVCAAVLGFLMAPALFFLRPAQAEIKDIAGYFVLFRDRQVRLFMSMVFLFALHWGTEGTCYAPFLVNDLGIPERYVGYFMGPPLAVLGISTLVFGRLGSSRVVGPRGTLAVAFFCSGAGALMMSMSSEPHRAFVWRVVHEAGDGAWFLFMMSGIHRLFSADRAGGCAALVWFTAMCASGVSSFISASAAAAYGYALPQAVAAVLALVSLAGVPLLEEKKEPAGDRATLPANCNETRKGTSVTS